MYFSQPKTIFHHLKYHKLLKMLQQYSDYTYDFVYMTLFLT